ncbi:MAG: galactose-1-phosphate uridylyltransferase [Candidatus Levyibacteriota bacterium]
MVDFIFLEDPLSKRFVISAPRRATRPDIAKGVEPVCPFCIGREKMTDEEVFRIGGKENDDNWEVKVVKNKYPFAPIHEIVIHSPDHHKNFDELPLDQVERIIQTYKNRYNTHKKSGEVVIFNNHGEAGGESLPHPHTQLVVVPKTMTVGAPSLVEDDTERFITKYFYLFCPRVSQWPDETWIVPSRKDITFGDIEEEEITDLSFVLQRLIQIFDMRHGHEFPFNFYIYPGKNWYLRLTPRAKTLGGFEIATNVYVNTQDPMETMQFIKSNFENPDEEMIRSSHIASYRKGV